MNKKKINKTSDVKNRDFYEWDIKSGDYKRDDESTWRFFKKKMRRKRILIGLSIILYIAILVLVLQFILG